MEGGGGLGGVGGGDWGIITVIKINDSRGNGGENDGGDLWCGNKWVLLRWQETGGKILHKNYTDRVTSFSSQTHRLCVSVMCFFFFYSPWM